jgi:prepilin-type N-terminal cleavage/methylation domain-containing protein
MSEEVQNECSGAMKLDPELGRAERVGTISRAAFTLIELLVVISIIGLLAALVVPLSGVATAKMRTARVTAELNNYVTAIESYKLEVGQYPPDHGELRFRAAADPLYKTNAAMNPLFYELTGMIFMTNRNFRTLAENETVQSSALQKYFKRDGIRNSGRQKSEIPFKGFSPKASQFAELLDPQYDVEILAVPVPGPFNLEGNEKKKINPWFYDASSTNRHNNSVNGFDLWAEILVGGKTNIIGNWKN